MVQNAPSSVPIIFVADGSKSAPAIVPLTQKHSHVGLVVVESPRGPSFARNRGAEAARTAWAWFLDDDDIPVPGCLEGIEAELEGFDVIVGGLITGTGEELQYAKGLFTSALMVRLEVFQRAGSFDEMNRYAEERELFSRLEAIGAKIKHLDRPFAIKTVGSVRPHSLGSKSLNPTTKRPH